MMINNNYALAVEQARANNAAFVNFDRNTSVTQTSTVAQDTVTLSTKAQALMEGKIVEEIAPIYVKPETARELLAQNQTTDSETNVTENEMRFSEIMQTILDKRTGVDRKKLDEIEAMMKEISNNKNMSPEEKQQALEKLIEMREKVIEESIENQKIAKETV
ncbi:hypothetical protein [Thalassotalea profundi]|uniref:Uncharacterized protein n=1 Tax=Thalassotalea profundi TaxID=2036687 RepID=A0ABQ3IGI3_9GAMM|nr:hypothetical protein [Thalassotalea profundi]GHE78979.1 hypothetical protein GCM10011501_03620 [Thalassotalea profundi]